MTQPSTMLLASVQRAFSAMLLALALVMISPAASFAQDSGYVLGPDDTVQVVVYGQTEFNVTTRIKSDGTIVMPLIGVVKAAGQTNIGLAAAITQALEKGGLLKSPIVNVEILNYVSKTANVAGKVNNPGIIPLDRQYRVLEALLKAGWVSNIGATYVLLRRPGQPELRLEVDELVRNTEKDQYLRPGDTLYVPDAELAFLSGQINRPGSFPITPNMTIREAIAAAGGVTASGSSNKVGLARGGAKEISVDTSQLVQKNDVIVIKERLF